MADPIKASNDPALVDLNDLDGPKMVRETVCVAQMALGNLYGDKPDIRRHIDRLSRLADLCDQHRPLGPDGKHGTTRCTPTCGCIDKRTESDVADKVADPIKASIEVEIDPTPDDLGRFEVHWPNGNRTWPTAENLTALGLPVPSPPWSLGWVDADGSPVLDDLSRDDVEGLAQAIHQTSTSAGDKLVRALRKQLEADDA